MNAFNLITLTLPGVSVTYQGEEIGMTNTEISWEDTVDPSGCNCGIDHYADRSCSRDPERTPMQWNNADANAGFSSADKTWLPVNPNYETVNVKSEMLDPYSHLNFLKTIMTTRSADPAFDVGAVNIATQNNVMAYSRTVNPDFYTVFVVLVNFNTESTAVDFGGQFTETINTGFVIASTLGQDSQYPTG